MSGLRQGPIGDVWFTPDGVGGEQTLISAALNESVNVRHRGATGGGLVDEAEALQAAANYAASIGKSLYIPAGVYLVSTTVTIPAAVRVYGDGHAKSILRPTITNGTPCLQLAGAVNFHRLENFAVASSTVGADFITGAANAQACIGIALGSASSYCNRWHISGVRVYGCALGLYARGYIGTADNLWIEYCETGLQGIEMNSCDLNLRFENCRKSFAIENSAGLLLRQLLDEGGNSSGVLASTIDQCNGVHFAAPYWEYGSATPRASPYLKIGGTTECVGVTMTGVNLVDYLQDGVPGIDADLCNGLEIQGRSSIGQYKRSVRTTSNTKNLKLDLAPSGLIWHQDDSRQLGPAFNYFSNPNFDLWFRGNWAMALDANSAGSQETTIVRKGGNAVRITATAGTTQNRKIFWLTGAPCTAMRGKTMRVYAWVWVPDIAAYQVTGRTKLPSVLISSFNGATAVVGSTANNRATAGTWNLMTSEVAVQVDATRITLDVYANQSGVAADGSEYVILDSLFVTESSTPTSRVLNGSLTDHPSINCLAVGGKMLAVADAAPTDPGQTFAVGDQVLKGNVAAGGSPGWACTTAGIGGVAVFKAMANVAA
jgi:hypothetical protein